MVDQGSDSSRFFHCLCQDMAGEASWFYGVYVLGEDWKGYCLCEFSYLRMLRGESDAHAGSSGYGLCFLC